MKHAACALLLSLSPFAAWAQAEGAAAPQPLQGLAPPPQQVVIVARRPGPGVWKVSKGDHVMWVFGLHSPAAREMDWDETRIEPLVRSAQLVLMDPGPWREAALYRGRPLTWSVGVNWEGPPGATLRQAVPTYTYRRWLALKDKYIGHNDDVERVRPVFAATVLMMYALEKNGLTPVDARVSQKIQNIAMRNRIRMASTMLPFEPGRELDAKDEAGLSQQESLACFTKTVDNLENDIAALRKRADAWANGDIAALRAAPALEREQLCLDAIMHVSLGRDPSVMPALAERVRARWLEKAEAALAANRATFALLWMDTLLDPHGYLADLQARGYLVEAP